MTFFRLYAVAMGVLAFLTIRYKLGHSADRALAHEVTREGIKCVPGMVIASAMDHVSDLIFTATNCIRLIGVSYAHYAVVVERDGKLYAMEWYGYKQQFFHKHDIIPLESGYIYLHSIEDYLRYMYYYHPATINVFYPKRGSSLPMRLDWILDIAKEGYLHCCVFAYRYLTKAGMLTDCCSVVPRIAKYNPVAVRRGLLRAGFRERYFCWKK